MAWSVALGLAELAVLMEISRSLLCDMGWLSSDPRRSEVSQHLAVPATATSMASMVPDGAGAFSAFSAFSACPLPKVPRHQARTVLTSTRTAQQHGWTLAEQVQYIVQYMIQYMIQYNFNIYIYIIQNSDSNSQYSNSIGSAILFFSKDSKSMSDMMGYAWICGHTFFQPKYVL